MNKLKPNVLVIPFKYPVTFFQEQIDLLEDTFHFKVLKGTRTPIGRKKFIKKKLTGNFVNSTTTYSTHTEFSYFDVNHVKGIIKRKLERALFNEFDTVVKQIFEGEYPKLIHIQSLSDITILACDWAEQNNVPVLMTEHVLFYPRLCDEFSKKKYRVYERVNRLLCVSNYQYRNLLTSGVDIPNCGIIGNLVNDKHLPQEFNRNKKNGKAIFVASHGHDKDVHVLFDAVKILKEEGSKIKVDIYGLEKNSFYKWNGKKVMLEDGINDRGIENQIKIKGRIPHSQLLNEYQNYSFFISSSRSETFGIAVAEALMNGLPVVCTDSGGIREFVDESKGIIVPIRNPNELAQGIKRISDNISFNEKEISKAITEKYGVANFRKRLLNEYFDCLKISNKEYE